MPRNALGRGLSALIRDPEPQPLPQQQVPGAVSSGSVDATHGQRGRQRRQR